MKKVIKVIADTLFYFAPSFLIGVLGTVYLCFGTQMQSAAQHIILIVFGALWLVAWLLWARLTPCRRKWDFLAPIAATISPWYFLGLCCICQSVFTLFLVFPANLFLIVPSVVILIVTFLASSTYFRKNTVPQAGTVSLGKRVLLRVVAVVAGCTLLAIPPVCVAAAYPRLDAEYTKNVLVYYRAEQGEPVNTRTNAGYQLYRLEGLSPEEFLFSNNHWSLWDGTLPRIIMHPDVGEPLFTFPLRSLQFNDIERGNVVITDTDTLSAFRAFV